MTPFVLHEGKGRTKVSLSLHRVGPDLLVRLFNKQEHIGAVAISEFHPEEHRASTSVITRFGHKDDSIAYSAAHSLCKHLKKSVCAIAGIHLDNITEEEIVEIIDNCNRLIDRCIKAVGSGQCTVVSGQ